MTSMSFSNNILAASEANDSRTTLERKEKVRKLGMSLK